MDRCKSFEANIGMARTLLGTAFASGVVFLLTGCATMAHGTTQRVFVSSEPSGAIVFVDNRQVGLTPVDVELSRRHTHRVRFEKAGFAADEIPLTRKDSAWVIADIALSLLSLGAVDTNPPRYELPLVETLAVIVGVDTLAGGAFKLPPKVHATLEPLP